MHQLKKLNCGLIEGMIREHQSTPRLVHAKSSGWLFTPARHTYQARAGVIFSPSKVCKFVVQFFSSVTQEDRMKLVE